MKRGDSKKKANIKAADMSLSGIQQNPNFVLLFNALILGSLNIIGVIVVSLLFQQYNLDNKFKRFTFLFRKGQLMGFRAVLS